MKKLFVLIVVLITTLSVEAQIADVQIFENGYVKVFDQNNRQISNGYIGSGGDILYSNCMLVSISDTRYFRIYDENLRLISSNYAGESDATVTVAGCNIITKGSTGYKRIYDKNLHLISSGY